MAAIKRLVLLGVVAAAALALVGDPAAADWRRGYGPYGWGWWGAPDYYGNGPYGPGFYDPRAYYYVPPPPAPDPAYVRLWAKCRAGRIPARWVKTTDKQGQEVWQHQMGRCR